MAQHGRGAMDPERRTASMVRRGGRVEDSCESVRRDLWLLGRRQIYVARRAWLRGHRYGADRD
jgi:hypothetical protein